MHQCRCSSHLLSCGTAPTLSGSKARREGPSDGTAGSECTSIWNGNNLSGSTCPSPAPTLPHWWWPLLWRVPRGVEATPTIGLLAAISHARSLADTPIYRQKYGQGEPPPENYWRGRALATETSCTSRQPTDSHSYCDLPGHILESCPSSSAAITINGCCTTDQACPRCPTSAHGKRSPSLRSPSTRLPTSPGCVLCRPPPPRRSRSRHPPSLYQVWPWGCGAHSGRNPHIASSAERGSPPTASETSSVPWLAVLVASNAGPIEGVWFVWSPSNFQGHHPAHRSQSKSPTLCSSNRLCMQPTQFRRTAAHTCGRAASQSNQQGPALEGGWTAYLD